MSGPLSAQSIVAPKETSGSEISVAVASNFVATARALVAQYSSISNDSVRLLVGSSGKHASQIRYGLPVDVFLAADSARPELLEKAGIGVAGSRFTYAIGRLALWSNDPSLVDPNGDVLKSSNFTRLAIANPKTAPYGVAAKQVIDGLGLLPKLVYGESVGQAFQFASSGNAELALLAFSQVKNLQSGSQWLVPGERHQVIEQQLIVVRDSSSARNFVDFIRSEKALKLIEAHGYMRP